MAELFHKIRTPERNLLTVINFCGTELLFHSTTNSKFFELPGNEGTSLS